MVSSTLGSATGTCWKRRSSAASCSMVFLNFSDVDAPMHFRSPRPSVMARFDQAELSGQMTISSSGKFGER
jgi:hypothetical protein